MSDNQSNEKEKLSEAYEKKDKILVEMIKSYKAKTEFMRYCCQKQLIEETYDFAEEKYMLELPEAENDEQFRFYDHRFSSNL